MTHMVLYQVVRQFGKESLLTVSLSSLEFCRLVVGWTGIPRDVVRYVTKSGELISSAGEAFDCREGCCGDCK
jgi:hypothetical protein